MKIGQQKRIGIVGGGPAGLSCALALKNAGYENVVVIEKAEEVGGKCRTIQISPGVTYELGASSMTQRYTQVSELLDHYKITPKPVTTSRFFQPAEPEFDETESPWVRALKANFASLLLSGILLLPRICRREKLLDPGFLGVSEERLKSVLSKVLLERLGALGIGHLENTFRTLVTGIGYGYIDLGPAAYLWKYLSVWAPDFSRARIEPREYELFDTGFQGLFKRVAEELPQGSVRTGCEVTRIDRGRPGPDPVEVELRGGDRLHFDYLVLACPLDDAAHFLDTTSEEKDIFGKIRSYTFHTLFVNLKGYPANRWGFFLRNFSPDRPRMPVLSARRHLELDHVVFYVLDRGAPREVTDEPGPCHFDLPRGEVERIRKGAGGGPVDDYIREIWKNVDTEIEATLGLRGIEPLRHLAWKYFPHFESDDVERGLPHRLEKLQGKRHTYYVGEIMDFSIIERVVRYSQHVVKEYFTGNSC